jgi:hypothetical protein
MTSQSQSVNVPQDIRSARDDARATNSRIIRDLRHRDVFVIDSRPTR